MISERGEIMKKYLIIGIALILMTTLGIRQFMYPKEIYIGFGAGLSGQWSQLGVQIRNGFLQAIEDINAEGGINGYKLVPVVMDDKNDNDYTEKLLKEMAEKDIHYLVGFSVSSMTPSVHKILEETDILIFSPTMSTNSLTAIDDNFFRVCNASIEETRIIIDTLKKEAKKDFTIVYDISNRPYTEPMRNTIVESASENGLSLVHEEAFDSGTVDYDLMVERIHKKDASNIIIFASGVDTAQIAQRLKVLDSSANLYSAAWATTDELLHSGGQAVEGMRVSGLYDIKSTAPSYLTFKEKMESKHNDSPSFPEIYGYESMMILREGMVLADSFDTVKVKSAIINQSVFQGLQQEIKIDAYGDAYRAYYVYEVKNGAFKGID